jgi:hypothetical protein
MLRAEWVAVGEGRLEEGLWNGAGGNGVFERVGEKERKVASASASA